MNTATIRRLLRLYPRNWRDRYEEEFVALLEQQPATFGACAPERQKSRAIEKNPMSGETAKHSWGGWFA